MTNILVKIFVKNSTETDNPSVRSSYGVLTSIVGIICNVLLFGTKLFVGLLINSVSVMADAFNNLSDAGSSAIGFIGVKISQKPADKDHPFGHGRIEYIAALIVAFLVIEVGFTFLKDSISKISNPKEITFHIIPVAILLISIAVKLWLAVFNNDLGKRVNSTVMKATAADAIGDVITTSATIFSVLINHFTGENIDAIVGIIVAAIVMWTGFKIARDTLEPLIGQPVNREIYREITGFVGGYEGILGSHDLILHNYGPNRSMGSIHAEVSQDVDVVESHELIDKIEHDIFKELGIYLVIHMDPIQTDNDTILRCQEQLIKILDNIDPRLCFHDLRMVNGNDLGIIIFDLVVPFDYIPEQEDALKLRVETELKDINYRYRYVITVEKGYVAEK